VWIAEVAANQLESVARFRHAAFVLALERSEHVDEVRFTTRRKIIDSDDMLTQLEQAFEQIRADETGDTRDQKTTWLSAKLALDLLVATHTDAPHKL
jgi:hypothetical protein